MKKRGRKSMKEKVKHCKKCDRILRAFNKSGYCSNCYCRFSDNTKESKRKYMRLHRERLKRLRELRC